MEIAKLLAESNAMRFLVALEQAQTGPLKFRVEDSLDFAARIGGQRPESETDERAQNAAAIQGTVNRAAPVAIGFEIPYAKVGDAEVNPDSARALGRDIAAALVEYGKETQETSR